MGIITEALQKAIAEQNDLARLLEQKRAEIQERETRLGLAPGWQAIYLPTFLPLDWHILVAGMDGAMYRKRTGPTVIMSASVCLDNKCWLHVSTSTPTRLPTWCELIEVKDIFIGPKRKAIQVFPSRAEYVNQHPYALHLWSCLDADPLPDFTEGMGTI